MSEELREKIEWFREEYLDTPAGQKHLAVMEAEPKEVRAVFGEIREKHLAGEDITDDVLRRLLPHADTKYHREHGYRASTWPCITKDIRAWFEGAGWKKPEDWPDTARLIFEAVDGMITGNEEPWKAFLKSEYRRGFGTGFISPILFCLDEQFPVINSKVIKTYKYCMGQLGEADEIDARLAQYPDNAQRVKTLLKRLEPLGLGSIGEFDLFCHFMVSKRLGGGDLTQVSEPDHRAWLFVANPEIYRWEQAFREGGVEWTRSLGTYAQKLLRRSIRGGDRAFGYQAGPDYELWCELQVKTDPYKTADGTWATDLTPVRRLEKPVSLSSLKGHAVLSDLKFLQQTQMSITGITAAQLEALDELITGPGITVEVSRIEELCDALRVAQFDTSEPGRYESLVAQAFGCLGFEAEHIGGPGKPDVVVRGWLGADTYTAIVEAKSCRDGYTVGMGQVDYASIREHREDYTADYALLIGPAFAGGKLVQRARKDDVGMITTDALIAVLKRHDQFPYSIAELHRVFERRGAAEGIERELGRLHDRHAEYLELTTTVLGFLDEHQRQEEEPQRVTSEAIYWWLRGRAVEEGRVAPDQKQIDEVLALLSNPVLDVLTCEGNEYHLAISPSAARTRVEALGSVLSSEE